MQCGYRGWIIDATPDFSLGKFFAHARLVRISTDDDVDGEMHIERHLGWFDTEVEAIEAAQEGAFAWICKRDGSVDSRPDGLPASRNDMPVETSAERNDGYVVLAPN